MADFEQFDDAMARFNKIRNNEPDDWIQLENKEQLKLKYKLQPGKSLYTFYGVKVVKAPMINLASILLEFDLYKSWTPNCMVSEVLAETSHFRKLVHQAIQFPWPFHNRCFYCNATGT